MDRLAAELAEFTPQGKSICTIGVFDGVHRGHKALIQATREAAEANGASSVVILLHPHPRTVLSPGAVVPVITPLAERIALIKDEGIDIVVPLTFDRELAAVTAPRFLSLLQEHLHLCGLVVGPDFALGRDREGNIERLQEYSRALGYTLQIIPMTADAAQKVSSSAVRAALAVGDVAAVRSMLGRPFVTEGRVIHGAQLGRTLGFPTANLALPADHALPADGIYANYAHAHGVRYDAAAYVGTRPTFGGEERLVEVMLLNFEGNLYDAELQVEWIEKVRDDRKFDSAEALQQQMERDIARVKQVLAAE